MVFQWAAVNSVAYRSAWQRLQWMAYKAAPEAVLVCTGFSGVVGGPAETKGTHTVQMTAAITARPIPTRSRGFNEPGRFMIFIGVRLGDLDALFPNGKHGDCSGKLTLHLN